MNVDDQGKKYRALDQWFDTPQGARAAQAFSEEIVAFKSQLRGERLLQLGTCGSNPWLSELQYRQKMIVSPCLNQKGVTITTFFNQLPFDRDSIDCIIAPLTLEAYSFDKNPINELDRILKPMGYIVFWGINPMSCWGLALKLGFLPTIGDTQTKLTSVFTLKNTILNMSYRQCALSTFYYIPPVKRLSILKDLEFLNEMGKMLWLYPAGFYCLVVQKHEIISPTLTLTAIEDNYLTCMDNSLAQSSRRSLIDTK